MYGKGLRPARLSRIRERATVHLRAIIATDRKAVFPEPQRILVAQGLTESERSFEREMQEIAKHRRTKDGGTLTNMTDGGPGKAGDEADVRRRLKALGKFRRMYVANSRRAAVLDYEECRRQCNMNPKSGRGVEAEKRLFEQPSTMQELCDHIKVMPALGPYKGTRFQPTTEDSVGKALSYIAAATESDQVLIGSLRRRRLFDCHSGVKDAELPAARLAENSSVLECTSRRGSPLLEPEQKHWQAWAIIATTKAVQVPITA